MQIQTQSYGENKAVISIADLQKLVELANKIEPIEFKVIESDFDSAELMRLAETGGAMDFLNDESEDIYSVADLKVSYK